MLKTLVQPARVSGPRRSNEIWQLRKRAAWLVTQRFNVIGTHPCVAGPHLNPLAPPPSPGSGTARGRGLLLMAMHNPHIRVPHLMYKVIAGPLSRVAQAVRASALTLPTTNLKACMSLR